MLTRTSQPTTEIGFDDHYSWTQQPWYLKAERVRLASWTDPYEFATGKKEIGITFAKPIYDEYRNLTAIVAVDLALDRIADELQRNKLPLEGIEFVSDAKGNILASSLGPVFVNCSGHTEFSKHIPVVCPFKKICVLDHIRSGKRSPHFNSKRLFCG